MMKPKPTPSQDTLKAMFDYDPLSGELRWRERSDRGTQWNARFANTVAGKKTAKGYVAINLKEGMFFAHRLIWKLVFGTEAPADIDHRHGAEAGNGINNLRVGTRSQNLRNMRPRGGRSIPKGVTVRPNGRFIAQISVNNVRSYLGSFGTQDEAHAAYAAAATAADPEFARVA